MIVGTADPEVLAQDRPSVEGFGEEAIALPGARVLQAMFEMPMSARESLVPPALHPTNPAALVILAWQCPESPWGPFSLVQLRAQARSGTRPRGFVVAARCDSEPARAALAARFGFPAEPADIALVPGYDRATLRVETEGQALLDFEGGDPDPLAAGDVQYSVTLNLAGSPRGLRLLQVEPAYAVERAERLRPVLRSFDGAAWGDPRLDPYHPVSASIASADITLSPIRYLCRPDVLAFEGSEKV